MRATLLSVLAIVAGCYAPTPPDGVPCGDLGRCPHGQECDSTGRCRRDPAPPLDSPPLDIRPLDAPPDVAIDAPASVFLDDFARPNGAIGNGWIEKNSMVYSLSGGEVVRVATATASYRDNMVYRPPGEDVLDVAITVGVRFTALPPRFAQIFVRGISATINRVDAYDGYLLYVDGGATNELVLGRQIGMPFVVMLSRFTLAQAFTTADRYRLSLSASGTQPVMLAAKVEKLVGATWTSIGSTTFADSDPARIAVAGTVGFSGDEIETYVYDDFRRTAP